MIPGLTSVIMPTCNRVERVLAEIEDLKNTTTTPLEIIVVIDKDEVTRNALMKMGISRRSIYALPYSSTGGSVAWPWGERDSYISAENITLTNRVELTVYFNPGTYQGCARCWNIGLALSRGEYIGFATDDQKYQAGWLDKSIAALDNFPDKSGMIGYNDLHWNGKELAVAYLQTRKFIIEKMGGCLGFEHYFYCCNDSEAHARAILYNRFYWCTEAIVGHEHPTYSTRESDQNDKRNALYAEKDFAEFFRRKALGFPNDFKPAIIE